MDKLEQFELLKSEYEKYPVVAEIFNKLCLRYRKTGVLQRTLTIKNITKENLSDFRFTFGNDNVKNQTINIFRFINEIVRIEPEQFIDCLFDITGVDRKDPKKIEREEQLKLLLKLEIIYPELENTIKFLNCKVGSKYFDGLTFELLEKICKITSSLLDPLFLINNDQFFNFSYLGTYFGLDSKRMRKNTQLYNLAGDFLREELRERFDSKCDRKLLFEAVGITDNPTAIKVSLYAPLIYKNRDGKVFDWVKQLWECGESATISMDNIKNIDKCYLESERDIKLVTCENESPFNKMIREEKDAVIYTAGYPNLAVKKLLQLLSGNIKTVYHWGDSDLDGYRIASIIHEIIPIELYRCREEDCRNHKDKLKLLKPEQKKRINDFITGNSTFKFIKELLFTRESGWLEQEDWNIH